MKDITKTYTNGEVTIVWKPTACTHSNVCWKAATGLPHVFNPAERPWIKTHTANTDEIITQIKKCPSGALRYTMNNETPAEQTFTEPRCAVEVKPNGPLMVFGNLKIKDKDSNETLKDKITAFCRCGASANKPYCDGSHNKIGFIG